MSWIQILGIFVVGILLGLLLGFWTRKRVVERQYDSIRNYSKKIINEAHKRAKALKKDAAIRAKDTLYQMKLEFDRESKEKKEQMAIQEKRIFHKEENLDKKIEQYEQKEKKLFKREKDIEAVEHWSAPRERNSRGWRGFQAKKPRRCLSALWRRRPRRMQPS